MTAPALELCSVDRCGREAGHPGRHVAVGVVQKSPRRWGVQAYDLESGEAVGFFDGDGRAPSQLEAAALVGFLNRLEYIDDEGVPE